MKVGDLVRDTTDGVVGIITRAPYAYGNLPLTNADTKPNVIDILWSTQDKLMAMHLAAFNNGIEIIT